MTSLLPAPADCPFCRTNNLLKGDVLAETEGGFMVEGQFGVSYLIIPDGHYESVLDLPDNWWQDLKALLSKVPGLADDYNVSLNYGKNAGQSVKHLHFWVIPREGGKPSSGKGFARLIAEADDTQTQE